MLDPHSRRAKGFAKKPPLAANSKRIAARARKARHRARQRKGERVFQLVGNYEFVVGGLIGSGRISERDALVHSRVERVLSAMLMGWAKHWAR
jgi:hypothetical protein